MSKKIIIGAVVVILLVAAVGAFIFLKGSKKDMTVDSSQNPNSATRENFPTGTVSSAKVKIEEIKAGTGPEVKSGDTVSVNYIGTLTNGTKFDSSYDRKVPFDTKIGVGQVIKGWDQGIVGMKVGGKRKLTVPPELAYGAQGAGTVVPPNATLVFEIELISIK